MANETTYIFDEHKYHSPDEFPDIGGWQQNNGTYYGISAEKDKLPIYDDMPSGKVAICTDTGEMAFYNKPAREWHWQA